MKMNQNNYQVLIHDLIIVSVRACIALKLNCEYVLKFTCGFSGYEVRTKSLRKQCLEEELEFLSFYAPNYEYIEDIITNKIPWRIVPSYTWECKRLYAKYFGTNRILS